MKSKMLVAPVSLLAFAVCLLAAMQFWSYSNRLVCIDFYQFWAIGNVVRRPGTADVYEHSERHRLGQLLLQEAQDEVKQTKAETSKRYRSARIRRFLEATSTPWLYSVFGVFQTGNFDRDQDGFQHIVLIGYLLAIGYMCHSLGFSFPATSLAIILFLSFFAPAYSDANVGNISRLQFALLALFLWIQHPRHGEIGNLLAGIVLGNAILLKPNLGFVALMIAGGWIILRQYRRLLFSCSGMVIGALVALGISGAYFGSFKPWVDWLRQLSWVMGGDEQANGNFSLAWVLAEKLDMPVAIPLVVLLCGLPLFLLRRRRESAKILSNEKLFHYSILFVSIGCMASLLGAGLAWLHYFVLIIPSALFLLRPSDTLNPMPLGQAIVPTLTVLSILFIALDPILPFLGITSADPGAAYIVITGSVLIYALLVLEVARAFHENKELTDK